MEDEIAADGDDAEIRGNLLHGFAGERLSRELLENSVQAIQGTREVPTVVRIAVAASTLLPDTVPRSV